MRRSKSTVSLKSYFIVDASLRSISCRIGFSSLRYPSSMRTTLVLCRCILLLAFSWLYTDVGFSWVPSFHVSALKRKSSLYSPLRVFSAATIPTISFSPSYSKGFSSWKPDKKQREAVTSDSNLSIMVTLNYDYPNPRPPPTQAHTSFCFLSSSKFLPPLFFPSLLIGYCRAWSGKIESFI